MLITGSVTAECEVVEKRGSLRSLTLLLPLLNGIGACGKLKM
jgi:hypothetical protein